MVKHYDVPRLVDLSDLPNGFLHVAGWILLIREHRVLRSVQTTSAGNVASRQGRTCFGWQEDFHPRRLHHSLGGCFIHEF